MVGCWGCWSPSLAFARRALTLLKAIWTLLQPPIVRTGLLPHAATPVSGAHKPLSTRDIPPVALTNIAHVDTSEFKPYLDRLRASYEQLQRVEGAEDKAIDVFHKGNAEADELATDFHDGSLWPGKRPPATRKGSVFSVSSSVPMVAEAPSPSQRRRLEFARRAKQGPPPLTAIPAVYANADFHLENPRTFDVVTERSGVVSPQPETRDRENVPANPSAGTPRKALASNAILQEKLSWYVDTVEMHLTASISAASASFFAALGSLQDLHTEAADSIERIKELRNELDVLDQEVAINGLHIVRKRRRWGNLQQLQDATLQLRHIVDGVAACESLVDRGDIDQASKHIASLEKLVSGEPGSSKMPCKMDGQKIQLRDLRGTAALRGVGDDLATLRFRIGKAYETRCLSFLVGDLRRHSEAASAQEVLMRWTGAYVRPRGVDTQEQPVRPSFVGSTSSLRPKLLEIVTGLHRAGHLTLAAAAYRETVLKEVRNLVRRPLPSTNDEDTEPTPSLSTVTEGTTRLSGQQKWPVLARNLQALEPGDAETMLIKIYVGVTETLSRLTAQVKLLLDVASSLYNDPSSAARQTQELHDAIDLPTLLDEAVDIAQDRIVKLLRVRSEQSTRLSRARFLRYFSLNLGFVSECESISGRSGTALKTVVNGQIKDFIERHGEAERRVLTQGMESDQWEAMDFSENDTAKLNLILSCSTTDPAEWSNALKVWIPCSDSLLGPGEAGDPQPGNGSRSRSRRNACVGEQTFVLPSSAILCMHGLSHFLQLIFGMPSMATAISTSLVSYLRHFNACCTRLVLDAGARQSAGLKRITSKHLSLASQALAFIATLTSRVREFVRRNIGRGSTALHVVELDEVDHLCHENQNRMHDMLVRIMSRLAESHVKALKNIDWDDGQKDVHPYVVTLVKDTKSLHRILTKAMPKETIRKVMAQAFLSYKVQFGQAFQEVAPKTETVQDSMLLDVEFLESNLGMMEGFSDAGKHLTAIVKARHAKIAAVDAPATGAEAESKKTETR